MNEVAVKPEHIPIYRLEQAILSLPQVEIPVTHQFCKGIYARSITIPAGIILTGALHKDECFFVVRSGTILITTDDEPIKAEAGFMAFSKAGSKRLGVALEDTVVTTFHANPDELRTAEELWNHITVPPPENLDQILALPELEEQ
jgi:quercetin dioxygenase-like cupin family protein